MPEEYLDKSQDFLRARRLPTESAKEVNTMQDKQKNQGNQQDSGNQGLRQRPQGNQPAQQGSNQGDQHGPDQGQMPNRNRSDVKEAPERDMENEGQRSQGSKGQSSGQHDQKNNRGSGGQQGKGQ